MYELGLLEALLQLRHNRMHSVHVMVEGQRVDGPDFAHLPTHLSIAADGRGSALRAAAGMQPENLGVAIDALWLRIPKPAAGTECALMHVRAGRMLIAIDRGEYWQCGFIIRKGAFEQLQVEGLAAFKAQIAETYPATRAGLTTPTRWDDVYLLTVQVNRLRQWYRDGVLCIGDAAHAMSPAGGVGINLAIQDAVATANLLIDALREQRVTQADLAAVQKRRERATRLMQRVQVFAHARLAKVLGTGNALRLPLLLSWVLPVVAPVLCRLAARIIGLGFPPEHISTTIVAGRPMAVDADA